MADKVMRQVLVEYKVTEIFNVTVPRDWSQARIEEALHEDVKKLKPHHTKVEEKSTLVRVIKTPKKVYDLTR